jgi:hypothetical protein
MNDEIFSDLAIENTGQQYFNLKVDIAEVAARAIPTGIASQATLFKTTNGQLYLYIAAQSGQLLGDVQKIVQRMQCEAEVYMPPHGDEEYFIRNATAKFKAMFPGKHITSEEDLRYYKNLTPYNPALVRLSKVRGELRGYERESKTWRKMRDYSYSRIKPQA